MGTEQLIIAMNTAGTLAIGSICFFIVYTTFRGIHDDKIQEFSKRFMMAIAVLILYVSYQMMYNSFTVLQKLIFGKVLLYLILVVVFLYLIYAAISFENLAKSYGLSNEEKLEKMEKEELG